MGTSVMEFDAVRDIVAQSYPFYMIDRVVRIEEGRSITCLKNVSGNEPHFQGHFPERAVFPGALILEAMGQAGSILLRERIGAGRIVVVSSAKSRFLRTVIPGDQLVVEVELVRLVGQRGGISKGVARVDGNVAATAEIVFGFLNGHGASP